MRRRRTTLATGALAALLMAGCGQEETGPGEAADPADSPATSRPTETPSDTADPGGTMLSGAPPGEPLVVEILVGSNADGATTTTPVELGDDAAVEEFVAGLGAGLPEEVRATVDALRASRDGAEGAIFGAVVHVGCNAATGISLDYPADAPTVTAVVDKETVECLVPVTSVAVYVV